MVLTNQSWQWNVVGGAAEFLFHLGLLAFTRVDVDLGRELSQPLSAGNVGGSSQHFGRAKRLAHEQYCLGSAVANLTCRQCGEIFVHMNARSCTNAFVLKSAQMPMEWFIGRVCAVLRLGFLLMLPGGIGPQHNISNTFTTKIVGAVALNN